MKTFITTCLFLSATYFLAAQNRLNIPPALTGDTFNLEVQEGVIEFFPGVQTKTYGVNGPLLGPTLFFKKNHWVNLNVTNHLTGTGNSTTMHWHGLHVPAYFDGGPHQSIAQNATWRPRFQVLNHAGTFWYHPHGAGKTDLHVSKGLAGLIIIQDSAEAALALPRTYGVDDFPLVLQTKSFDVLKQIAIATAFDTLPLVNGTVDPVLEVPAQVVRFRVLNGASERSFLLGLSNKSSFKMIASDGGLLDSALSMNRLLLSNGERAEILVDFSGQVNDTLYLMSYGAELPNGVIGADSVGDALHQMHDYYENPLNGADYSLLKLIVKPPTANPITTIPAKLVAHPGWQPNQAKAHRRFDLDTLSSEFVIGNPAEGPFGINRTTFDMDTFNEVVYLNDVEIWTIRNMTLVAHPFHIHDIQFHILDLNGRPVPPHLRGLKDVVLVMPGDSVRLITRFEDFAHNSIPYMYHCHILHHEDEGMMGSFVVVDTSQSARPGGQRPHLNVRVAPNPSADLWRVSWAQPHATTTLRLSDALGRTIVEQQVAAPARTVELPNAHLSAGIYYLSISTDAAQTSVKLVKY